MVSDAYLVYSTRLFAQVANTLGEAAIAYQCQRDSIKLLSEFHQTYVTPRSRLMSDSQTALALLLHFDFVDPEIPGQRAIWSARLEELVLKDFWQVSTGLPEPRSSFTL